VRASNGAEALAIDAHRLVADIFPIGHGRVACGTATSIIVGA
jgi:hypothetical protein